MEATIIATQVNISAEAMLKHWQGHRSLTRRVIEAFPEDKLLSYSLGGMRTFAQLAFELIDLAEEGIIGMATNEWKPLQQLSHYSAEALPATKQDLLRRWDETTAVIERYWPQLTTERFGETVKAFGMFEGTVYDMLFYWIDNENHHRGQGYVYLRTLGIEPPPFWDR